MMTLTIDNKPVQAQKDATILDAAQSLGIYIPTLCYYTECNPSTSCMVCVVRVEGIRSLVPACATKATDGMVVDTQSDPVRKAQKAAIELLLSDHIGDCVGPCQKGCPAGMNIPQMIRQIEKGDFKAAIETIKKEIPLPAILGRICSAPCEKVCRRNQVDSPVSICLLKRFAADVDLACDKPYKPVCAEAVGKHVAIIGAGPCGLSAAYYLKLKGIDCTLFEAHEKPGGTLLSDKISRKSLPLEVIEKEVNQVLSLGISLKCNTQIGKDTSFDEIVTQHDATLIATGGSVPLDWGIRIQDGNVQVDRHLYTTSKPAVFAAGACIGSRAMAIRAVADGKEAAASIASFVSNQEFAVQKDYNHRIGRLENEEIQRFSETASKDERIEPKDVEDGFTRQQARGETTRCLHCDCRKADNCKLRHLATQLEAKQAAWQGAKDLFEQMISHEQVVFEPGKCIKCGLCIQIAQKCGESIGLAFNGRGFRMRLAVPLEKTFAQGLAAATEKCVEICPTGALAMKEVGG